MEENKPEILDLLIRHELAIKRLYDVYAVKFPEYREFWKSIAIEEQDHAGQLELLGQHSSALSNWMLMENRLKAEAVRMSIKYINDQTTEAEAGRLTFARALVIAKDIELALLEKIFFSIGHTVPAEIKPILQSIAADTERHHKSIEALLDAEKRKASILRK